MKYYVGGQTGDGQIHEKNELMKPIRDVNYVKFVGIGYQVPLTIVHETSKAVLVHKPAHSAWFGRNTTSNFPAEYMLFKKETNGWRLRYKCEPGRFWRRLRAEMIRMTNSLI